MKLTYEQLRVSLERSEVRVKYLQLTLKEKNDEYDDLADYTEMVQDMNNKLYTVIEINNIDLDFEGELH